MGEKANTMRHGVLSSGHRRYKTDGLNSLVYSVLGKELRPLYTMVNVILNKTEIDNNKDNIVRRSRVVSSKSKSKVKTKEVKNSPAKDGVNKMIEKVVPAFIHPHVAS